MRVAASYRSADSHVVEMNLLKLWVVFSLSFHILSWQLAKSTGIRQSDQVHVKLRACFLALCIFHSLMPVASGEAGMLIILRKLIRAVFHAFVTHWPNHISTHKWYRTFRSWNSLPSAQRPGPNGQKIPPHFQTVSDSSDCRRQARISWRDKVQGRIVCTKFAVTPANVARNLSKPHKQIKSGNDRGLWDRLANQIGISNANLLD